MSDDFVWGPWAGMGRRPVPVNLKRQRSYRRCWWWGAAIVVLLSLYYWLPK